MFFIPALQVYFFASEMPSKWNLHSTLICSFRNECVCRQGCFNLIYEQDFSHQVQILVWIYMKAELASVHQCTCKYFLTFQKIFSVAAAASNFLQFCNKTPQSVVLLDSRELVLVFLLLPSPNSFEYCIFIVSDFQNTFDNDFILVILFSIYIFEFNHKSYQVLSAHRPYQELLSLIMGFIYAKFGWTLPALISRCLTNVLPFLAQ